MTSVAESKLERAEKTARALVDGVASIDAVLLFDIADDVIVKRLSARTVCDVCQTPFTGREPGEPCPKPGYDGGHLVRRKDDEPEAIRHRLAVFERETAPVLDWYRTDGAKVVRIDADAPVQAVTARALSALGL